MKVTSPLSNSISNPPTHHITYGGWGLRRWPLAGASRDENSLRSDGDLGIHFERHRSSRERLGNLPALLEREVVALEDLTGRLDELRYVIASAHHRFRLVTIVEVGRAFDRVTSVRIVAVGSNSHTHTHDPQNPSFFGSLDGPFRPKTGGTCRSSREEWGLKRAGDSRDAHETRPLVCIFGERDLSTCNPRGLD